MQKNKLLKVVGVVAAGVSTVAAIVGAIRRHAKKSKVQDDLYEHTDIIGVQADYGDSKLVSVIGDPSWDRYVTVQIEEHLCREVKVFVPEGYEGDLLEYGESMAKVAYKNEEIILQADDFNGTRLMQVDDNDGHSTDWFEVK